MERKKMHLIFLHHIKLDDKRNISDKISMEIFLKFREILIFL